MNKHFLIVLIITLVFTAVLLNFKRESTNQQNNQFLLKQSTSSNSNTVKIQVLYPQDKLTGKSIFIRGDECNLNWNKGVQLTKDSQSPNLWYVSLANCANTGYLQFKVLISDKDWMVGSNAKIDLQYISKQYTISPYFNQQAGTFTKIKNFYSKVLNNYRDIIIYLPPSFTENTVKQYENVLIMHDGQNLFDPKTAFMNNAWLIQNKLDPMINQGQIEEVMVVGLYNTQDRMNEYTYSYDPSEGFGGKGDKYLDFIEQEVIPSLKQQKNLRISEKVTQFGITGSSLGGLISCYAGWTRSNVFNKVGCMSSSFWWNSQDFLNSIMAKNPSQQTQNLKFYLDSGNVGPGQDDVKETGYVRDKMILKYDFNENINLYYYLDQGASHSETYWGKRFNHPLEALYPKSKLQPDD